MNELVSIVMGTYNGADYLRKLLDSLYSQTYKNTEIVVCDDHSVDSTVDILKEYETKGKLKYWVNEQNIGFKKNFERSLKRAEGSYIALCDQDDIWLPHKLEILLNQIGDHSIIFSDMKIINAGDEVLHDSYLKYRGIEVPSPQKASMFLNFNNFVTGCASLLKRDLIDKALPIPERALFHDWWFAMVAARQGGIKFFPESLVLYRRHGKNVAQLEKKRTAFFQISSYLTPEYRQWWKEQRINMKDVLLRRLDLPLKYQDQEENILKESIEYVDLFLKGNFKIRFFKYGWKYRKYYFKRPIYFWLEYLAYIFSSIKNNFIRSVNTKKV